MQSDLDLVQRTLLLDDRKAYSQLVRKYQVAIRTYLARLTRNKEIADDLAQDTFLAGYRRLAQIHDGAKYQAWIYSIAHNEYLQWYRRQPKVTESLERELAGPQDEERAANAKIAVNELLQTMRPEEQSAIVLCLGHEFSHAEAAAILKIPVGTVKSLILRTRQKLTQEAGGTGT